jgi:hypothetical protein
VDTGLHGRLLLSVVSGFELVRGTSPSAEWSRVVFHQWTQASVASSTSSAVRQGPGLKMSSLL